MAMIQKNGRSGVTVTPQPCHPAKADATTTTVQARPAPDDNQTRFTPGRRDRPVFGSAQPKR
ncbi:hypothetical protein GCM10027184_76880 [Saccharothrix stipae]